MRSKHRILLASSLWASAALWLAGCSREPPNPQFVGLWEGAFTEENQTVAFELFLRIDQDKNVIKGIFHITDKGGASSESMPPRDIVKVETAGIKLQFVVPLTGTIDDDSLIMNLEISGDRLAGSCRRKKSGSPGIPISLTRKPPPQADPNRFLQSTS